jgi:FkbM family methyltransferase
MHPDTTFVDTPDARIEYFGNDNPIGRSLAEYGEWSGLEIRLLCSFIGLGSFAVDVGANVGTHTLRFARRVGPAGRVLAFEPQRAVFDVLERNIKRNGLSNVAAVHAGVAAAEGEMMVPPVDYRANANIGSVGLTSITDDGPGERVRVLALDSYGLTACHLVKIDAEGMDADVVAGMQDTLERHRPVVSVECNAVADGARVLRASSWAGYRTFLVRTAAYNPDNPKGNGSNFFGVAHESNLLFVPEDSVGQLPESKPGTEILAIEGLNELAVAVLETPRYGDETVYDRNSARLREMLSQQAREGRDALLALETELSTAREFSAREIARLEFRAASLLQQLRRAETRATSEAEREATRAALTALKAANDKIAERERLIEAIHNSTSWRSTAPLRRLASLLRA